jgi:hypothetical protein
VVQGRSFLHSFLWFLQYANIRKNAFWGKGRIAKPYSKGLYPLDFFQPKKFLFQILTFTQSYFCWLLAKSFITFALQFTIQLSTIMKNTLYTIILFIGCHACTSAEVMEDGAEAISRARSLHRSSKYVQNLQWDRATALVNRWGKVQVGVPFSRTVESSRRLDEYLIVSEAGKEEFVLQVQNDKGVPIKEVLSDFDKYSLPGFTGKVLKRDVNSEVSSGFVFQDGKMVGKVFGNQRKVKRGRNMERECWEVYSVTYYTDGTTSEEHLYYFCIDEDDQEAPNEDGGGGSGDSSPTAECIDETQNFFASSELENDQPLTTGQLERTRTYSWKAIVGFLYVIRSYEVGVHKRNSSSEPWKWHSLQHQGLSHSGLTLGYSLNYHTISSNPTIGQYWSNMALNVNLTIQYVCKGFPLSTSRDFSPNVNLNVG